jgi:hypothetical protein
MNSVQRQKKEWLKDQLDRMESNEHIQIFNIIKKHTEQFTKTQTGILISTDNLSNECIENIEKYVVFSIDQRKRIEEDAKTRKTYERLVSDS